MKNSISILCLVLLPLWVVQAQEQKIGYVNTDEILAKLPEYQGISQRLNRITQQWRNEIDEMEQQIQELQKEFEAKEVLYTEQVRKQKKNEIEQLKQQKNTFIDNKFGKDGEYFQRQKELLEPVQRVVFDAVNTVAERDGFDMILDRAGDTTVIFSKPEWNLNDEVLLELGIDVQNSRN